MDPQDLNDMADDPRFVAGICNYCDRWCERCPFTSRCLNYAMSAEISGDLGANDLNNRRFWDNIRKAEIADCSHRRRRRAGRS